MTLVLVAVVKNIRNVAASRRKKTEKLVQTG